MVHTAISRSQTLSSVIFILYMLSSTISSFWTSSLAIFIVRPFSLFRRYHRLFPDGSMTALTHGANARVCRASVGETCRFGGVIDDLSMSPCLAGCTMRINPSGGPNCNPPAVTPSARPESRRKSKVGRWAPFNSETEPIRYQQASLCTYSPSALM